MRIRRPVDLHSWKKGFCTFVYGSHSRRATVARGASTKMIEARL